jgi:PAS domain S-box-containing protein
MLWLYLLGAVTFLVIVLRRVLRRQQPLNDELYSKQVAIDHVHSGVAWVRADGTIGSVNPGLLATLRAKKEDLEGQNWLTMFLPPERDRVLEMYTQALLLGKASLDTRAERPDGSHVLLNVVLVAVHDHKMRFVGHHCLTDDRTKEHVLEEKIRELTERVSPGTHPQEA